MVAPSLGLLMAGHGAQKLFGWLVGTDLRAPQDLWSLLDSVPAAPLPQPPRVSELLGGLLIAAGFLGPIGPALIVSVMIVAAVTVHWPHGLFSQTNGIELPLLYGTGGAALALTGFGGLSLDALLGLTAFWSPTFSWTVLALAVAGGFANLALRHTSAPVRSAA